MNVPYTKNLLPKLSLWLLALFITATPVVAQLLDETSPESWSRFQRTAYYLQDATPDEQAAFASDTLTQLAEVYMAEADLARAEAAGEQRGRRAKLLGWSVAVDQYANQLLVVLEDIVEGYPVQILGGREGAVSVSVAGRAVMLGHPRADQQSAFEQRVLVEFCTHNDCQRMTTTVVEAKPIPMSATRVYPRWAFTERGRVCTHEGIELRFSSNENLAYSRSTCEELMQEAVTLSAEIAWQRRHGVVVDWAALAVKSTPRRPEHLVRLNGAGDSLLLTVPLLFSSVELLEDIKPWLRERWSSDATATVKLNAADYGWE